MLAIMAYLQGDSWLLKYCLERVKTMIFSYISLAILKDVITEITDSQKDFMGN